MKILANLLFALGPLMMIFSRPFTDSTNFVLLWAGVGVGMVGLFMRRRVKAGTPTSSLKNDRRLYPQEIVILVLIFGVLLTFGLTPAHWFLFVFGLLGVGLGPLCIARPEWLVYGPKTPERLALDRISCQVSGFVLLPLGVFLVLLFFWFR